MYNLKIKLDTGNLEELRKSLGFLKTNELVSKSEQYTRLFIVDNKEFISKVNEPNKCLEERTAFLNLLLQDNVKALTEEKEPMLLAHTENGGPIFYTKERIIGRLETYDYLKNLNIKNFFNEKDRKEYIKFVKEADARQAKSQATAYSSVFC